MRSDELIDRVRKAADIGSVAAWPDYPDSRILAELTERHMQLMGDEEIRAHAGYGVQTLDYTTVAANEWYPVPPRAIGGAFEKLEIQPPGQLRFVPLIREEVSGSEVYDYGGNSAAGTPRRYTVRDGWVQVYPPPPAGLLLRFTFYIRPSQIVTSQCSLLGGDFADRGRVVSFDTVLRTVTVNAAPFDQLLVPPAPITAIYRPLVDIIRPSGTFALTVFDGGPYNYFGTTFSLLGTRSMARLQVGDYVRVADQAEWPTGLPLECHRMVANRAAAEIARDIGVEEKVKMLAAVADADLARFRRMRSPQVKSQPVVIPLRPMQRR